MFNTNYLLLILLFLINDSIHAPIRQEEGSGTTMIDSNGEHNETNKTSFFMVPQCKQTLTYEEIFEILTHTSCASSSTKSINESLLLHRKRRAADGGPTDDDETVASTNNIYALQSTINDHRTMIDDHRKMIHYLMNNTVNVTQFNQYYTDQHARTTPIWTSWRDVSLLLLIFICFGVIVCLLIKRLRLLDFITTILIRRQQQQQQLQGKSIPKKNMPVVNRFPPQHTEIPAPIVEPMSISNITRDYIRYERDSNSTI